MRFGPAGLIFARFGGIACNGIVLLLPLLKDARSLLRRVSCRSMIGAAKRHRQFPLFLALSSGINTFGREMPIIILSMFFGPAMTGFYALTRRVLNVPMILIGEQVRKVFYPYAAETTHMEDLRHLTKIVFASLVQIALPGVIILGLAAPALFPLVFGERWTDSGIYAQWLCPWLFLIFVCAPLSRLPLVLKRQGSELVFQMTLLVMRALALAVGGVAQDVMLAIGLFAGVSVLCWIGFLIWSMRLIGIGLVEVLDVLTRELVIAAPIVAPLVLARFVFFGPDQGLWLLAVGVGCALVAALVLIARTGHLNISQLGSRES